MNNAIIIRPAQPADAEQLLAIYKPYVISEDTSMSDVSFELEAPSLEEFRERISALSARFPYLVAELDGRLLGYVYCHPFRERLAYQWSVEVTIYMAQQAQGRGLGRVLYEAMEKILCLQGITMAYSCVTASNVHSVAMHEAVGYRLIGTFTNSGYKNGHWLDTVWLEKQLQPCPKSAEPIKGWHELAQADVAAILGEAAKAAGALSIK